MSAKRTKKIKRTPGDVLRIDLGDGTYAFGRVLPSTIGFYDLRTPENLPVEEVVCRPILFQVWVMDYAVTKGDWPVIGHVPLTEELLEEPLFFKRDPITKQLSVYRGSTAEDRPATAAECRSLECAAVWDPEHVVDRLRDHSEGKPNKWLESMRVKDDE